MAKPDITKEQVRELLARLFDALPLHARPAETVNFAAQIVKAAQPGVVEFDDLISVYRQYVSGSASAWALEDAMLSVERRGLRGSFKEPLLDVGRSLHRHKEGVVNDPDKINEEDPFTLPDAVAEVAYVALSEYSSPLVERTFVGLFGSVLESPDRPFETSAALQAFFRARWVAAAHTRRDETSVRMWIDPGRASADDIRAVLHALNALHVAAGGVGLTFEVDEDEILILQEADA
jgi:hypothetical protein